MIRTSAVLIGSTVLAPFIYLAGVIIVKWTVIGRFRADDDITRAWPKFERWLMWQLLPDGRFGGVAPLLGSNFAAVSVIYRLLGAKVGKRIYWPGSGNVITEYDLFECGDDVTFGSRSTYLMTSAHGSRPIRIQPGANVADRCVLAPGVVVGRNAVLGSGTFAPEGFVAPAGSTWIGQDGRQAPIELEAATPRRIEAETLRPYGRAMYSARRPIRCGRWRAHVVFNVATATLGALYRAMPMIGALLLARAVLIAEGPGPHSAANLPLLLAGFYLPLHLASAFGALGIATATKWLIIGRRVEGEQLLDAIVVLPALEDPQRHLVAVGRLVRQPRPAGLRRRLGLPRLVFPRAGSADRLERLPVSQRRGPDDRRAGPAPTSATTPASTRPC